MIQSENQLDALNENLESIKYRLIGLEYLAAVEIEIDYDLAVEIVAQAKIDPLSIDPAYYGLAVRALAN